jgi:hypothetical protein
MIFSYSLSSTVLLKDLFEQVNWLHLFYLAGLNLAIFESQRIQILPQSCTVGLIIQLRTCFRAGRDGPGSPAGHGGGGGHAAGRRSSPGHRTQPQAHAQ